MTLAWHEEPISKGPPRDGFDGGDSGLNTYLKKFARQNHESGGAKTFVAIDDASGRVLGFYSLAPAVAEYERTPEDIRRGLPRHAVPGYRLARLATDISVQGSGLGGQRLLGEAEISPIAMVMSLKTIAAALASVGK